MLVICLYTILTWRVSAAPHQAQCRYCSHSGWGVGWGEGRGCRRRPSSCVCACVQRRNDEQMWKTSGRRRQSQQGCFYVCACFSLKSSKSKPQLKMYICQSWANSDIKCQRARWNTDEIPPRFPPFIFKQMLWVFILLYKFCRKTQKREKTFLRTN